MLSNPATCFVQQEPQIGEVVARVTIAHVACKQMHAIHMRPGSMQYNSDWFDASVLVRHNDSLSWLPLPSRPASVGKHDWISRWNDMVDTGSLNDVLPMVIENFASQAAHPRVISVPNQQQSRGAHPHAHPDFETSDINVTLCSMLLILQLPLLLPSATAYIIVRAPWVHYRISGV